MDGIGLLAIIVSLFIAFAAAAALWGVDSRPVDRL